MVRRASDTTPLPATHEPRQSALSATNALGHRGGPSLYDSESYPSAQPGNQGRTTQLNALGARLERGRAGPGRLRGARTPYHIPMILQGCRWSRSWPPSSAICEHARASRPRRRNNSVLNAPATRLVRPCSQHCRQQPWQNNSAQCLGAPPRPIDSDQGVGVGRARATRRRANTAIGH